jgi:hypothetical protein
MVEQKRRRGEGGQVVTNSDKSDEQRQTATNSDKQRQTVTNSNKQRQTVTEIISSEFRRRVVRINNYLNKT